MSFGVSTSSLLAAYGSPWTLRRAVTAAGANAWTAGADTVTYHASQARPRAYKPHEIRGGIQDTDTELVLDPASLDVVPVSGDRVAPGVLSADAGAHWHQVVAVSPGYDGAEIVVYRLQVRR